MRIKKVPLSPVGFMTAVFISGMLILEHHQMPCGTTSSYNHQSFWWHPWTRGVNGSPHYGVDIFGKAGTPVHPSVSGIYIYDIR